MSTRYSWVHCRCRQWPGEGTSPDIPSRLTDWSPRQSSARDGSGGRCSSQCPGTRRPRRPGPSTTETRTCGGQRNVSTPAWHPPLLGDHLVAVVLVVLAHLHLPVLLAGAGVLLPEGAARGGRDSRRFGPLKGQGGCDGGGAVDTLPGLSVDETL